MPDDPVSSHYQWQEGTLLLHCQLQPRASINELIGIHNHRLKVRITAPPVDGKANQHLIALISKWFGTPKSKVSIVRGETGRLKTLLIQDPCRLPDGADITEPNP
ncbi:MAG: hypothetical protein ACI89Z_000378 [Porticoccus sp.]|jgi:uncharacterized protein (TIGR00251 family)